MQCVRDCMESVYANFIGYRRSRNDPLMGQEIVLDELNTRLVRLELQDRHCLSDARRHRASGSKTLFRSKMLEHRRVQGQIEQLHRFKENAMAQFDALSNHELNRTFIEAMKGIVGTSKSRVVAAREDAETVMEDLQESVTHVKDLSDILGQPVVGGMMTSSSEEVTDEDLESEFLEFDASSSSSNVEKDSMTDHSDKGSRVTSSEVVGKPIHATLPYAADNRTATRQQVEPILVLPPALSGAH
jgi:hypothetical protein